MICVGLRPWSLYTVHKLNIRTFGNKVRTTLRHNDIKLTYSNKVLGLLIFC